MQSMIIDNFLPYPNVVRDWALTKDFYNAEQFSQRYSISTNWPGSRSDHVMDLDMDYANTVLGKVSSIASMCYNLKGNVSIKSYFQLCFENDGDSWIHQDNDVTLAAILYLNPDAPLSSGTSLYTCKDLTKWNSLSYDDMTKINRVERQDLYNDLFEQTVDIKNVFNRLVIYNGDAFHKSNDYFGTNKHNSRLTQVFFLTYD